MGAPWSVQRETLNLVKVAPVRWPHRMDFASGVPFEDIEARIDPNGKGALSIESWSRHRESYVR